ncbi:MULTISPECIES: hypothetical protein, partial [Cyanophyceae]|uniref:hypothetical protein n=1 Tax=Cyanophyceae TaxID=3028117 RepID=UPI001A7E356E
GVDDLLAQIEAVGFGHGTQVAMSLSLVYVLAHMATAISPDLNLSKLGHGNTQEKAPCFS